MSPELANRLTWIFTLDKNLFYGHRDSTEKWALLSPNKILTIFLTHSLSPYLSLSLTYFLYLSLVHTLFLSLSLTLSLLHSLFLSLFLPSPSLSLSLFLNVRTYFVSENQHRVVCQVFFADFEKIFFTLQNFLILEKWEGGRRSWYWFFSILYWKLDSFSAFFSNFSNGLALLKST